MADPVKKVSRGQRLSISADAYNGFVDASADFKRRTQGRGFELAPYQQDSTIILIRNDTILNLDRFAVVGTEFPLILPNANLLNYQNRVALSGITPVAPNHLGRFAVLQAPAKPGAIVPAVIRGATPVKCHIFTTNDTHADIKSGSNAELQAGSGPARILWKETTTGPLKHAVVCIGDDTNQVPYKLETSLYRNKTTAITGKRQYTNPTTQRFEDVGVSETISVPTAVPQIFGTVLQTGLWWSGHAFENDVVMTQLLGAKRWAVGTGWTKMRARVTTNITPGTSGSVTLLDATRYGTVTAHNSYDQAVFNGAGGGRIAWIVWNDERARWELEIGECI